MTYPDYETEDDEPIFDRKYHAQLVKDHDRWNRCDPEWNPVNKTMKEAMEAAARAVEQQPGIIRQRIRDHAKDFYSLGKFGRLANRGIGTVRGWISRGQVETIRVAAKGPHGKLMIPGRELEKLFLGRLGVFVPTEVIDEELGQQELAAHGGEVEADLFR